MEIIVYAVVAGLLALGCCVLATKLCEKDRELEKSENRVRELANESTLYHSLYINEKLKNIALRSENEKLCRELFKALGVKDEGDV